MTERWIPRVEAALADVELGLAETERGESVRLRWAVGSQRQYRRTRRTVRHD